MMLTEHYTRASNSYRYRYQTSQQDDRYNEIPNFQFHRGPQN